MDDIINSNNPTNSTSLHDNSLNYYSYGLYLQKVIIETLQLIETNDKGLLADFGNTVLHKIPYGINIYNIEQQDESYLLQLVFENIFSKNNIGELHNYHIINTIEGIINTKQPETTISGSITGYNWDGNIGFSLDLKKNNGTGKSSFNCKLFPVSDHKLVVFFIPGTRINSDEIISRTSLLEKQNTELKNQNNQLTEDYNQLKKAMDKLAMDDLFSKLNSPENNIHGTFAKYTGEKYFDTLVTKIAETTGSFISLIAELKDNNTLKIISAYVNGEIKTDLGFSVDDLPCSKSISENKCDIIAYNRDYCPNTEYLKNRKIKFCVECPVVNSQGDKIGLIISLYENKLIHLDLVKNILRISSVRAAAEIERRLYEEKLISNERILKEQNEQYQKINKKLLQVNNDLVLARKKAEESDHLKTAFLANMSHEIRTPMNGIIGFAHLLGSDDLDREKREAYINIINGSAKQLLAIISDIVDISKIEANQLDIDNNTLKIFPLLNELYENFVNEKKTSFKNEIGLEYICPDKNLEITTDHVRLKQVLTNLLSNALKFTTKGEIKFGYFLNNKNEITFFVKDTGIGIDEENLKIIFDRFRQVEITNIRNYGGTGLGLTISKALIEKMGGNIWVESKLNKGSSFYFRIMINPEENLSPKTTTAEYPAEMPGNAPLKNKKILVVEDTKVSQIYIEELLLPTGALIIFTDSGKSAIEICESEMPEIILMDIQLPDLSGYDVTRMIRKFNAETIIIGQSAYAMAGDFEKAIDAGCDCYITKPYSKTKLLQTIYEQLLNKNIIT